MTRGRLRRPLFMLGDPRSRSGTVFGGGQRSGVSARKPEPLASRLPARTAFNWVRVSSSAGSNTRWLHPDSATDFGAGAVLTEPLYSNRHRNCKRDQPGLMVESNGEPLVAADRSWTGGCLLRALTAARLGGGRQSDRSRYRQRNGTAVTATANSESSRGQEQHVSFCLP